MKNPIPPAGDPVISERGKQAIRELVTILQATSAVNDAQGIVRQFPFNQSLVDSIFPRISLWDPAQSASLVLPTLGKRAASTSTLFTQLQSSVAATQGTSTLRKMPAINPALLRLDSLLAIGDTPLIRIRLALESISMPAPFDSGSDSIYGTWFTTKSKADSTRDSSYTILDSMIRILTIDSTTSVITRQHWKYIGLGNELSLLDLSQQHLTNGATRYFHKAKITETTIQDTIFSSGINGSMAASITRVDSSLSFFGSLDSSKLSDFTLDSTASGKLQKRVTLTGSNYTFNSTNPQVVRTKTTYFSPLPLMVTSIVALKQTMAPLVTPTVDSIVQTDAYISRDTIRYQIASPESAQCTLSVAAKFDDPTAQPSFLGNIASATYTFYTQRSVDSSSWKYTSFTRTDLLPDNSNPVASVTWKVVPKMPALLSDLGKRPEGYVSATAKYKFGEKTKKRFWSLCDSSDVDTLIYSWVNITGDSLSMKSLKDPTGSITYTLGGTGSTFRHGSLIPAGTLFTISDTLSITGSTFPTRIINANLASMGNGTLQILGDYPGSSIITDTAIHFSFPIDPLVRFDTIEFKRQGTSLARTWIHVLDRDTVDYRISWDNAQLMGASLHTRSASALKPRVDTLTILPTYNATTSSVNVYGIVENFAVPDSMSASLSLDLWNASYLQGIKVK